jgi:hypothetical protein
VVRCGIHRTSVSQTAVLRTLFPPAAVHGVRLDHALGQVHVCANHRFSDNLAHGTPPFPRLQIDDLYHPSWRFDADARRLEVPSHSHRETPSCKPVSASHVKRKVSGVSVRFFATSEDLASLLRAVFAALPASVVQSCSHPGQRLIQCETVTEAVDLLFNGEAQLGLWFPAVMPAPNIRRIALQEGGFRFCAEGCGLFWLNVGHMSSSIICASTVSWFTEAGAYAKCNVVPGPGAVDWPAHRRIAARLSSLIRRGLSVTSVSGRSVLPGALAAHRAGCRLKEHANAPYDYTVAAA